MSAPVTAPELITVTVRDRSQEASWGSGRTDPVTRKIQISAFCPKCSAPRGPRHGQNTCDDGAWYWVETWTCSAGCGHVDHYTAVIAEAARIAAENPVTATDPPRTPPPELRIDDESGPHTIVGRGEDCYVCDEPLEPGEVYVFVADAAGHGVAHETCIDTRGCRHE